MYFGNDCLQDAIYEQTVLNEMHISKKDLSDPKILDKVLKKTEKEVERHNNAVSAISLLLGVAADVALGLATGSLLASFVMFIPFLGGACALTMKFIKSYPDQEEKNLNKLVEKAKKLKANLEKNKDPKKEDLIKKCDDIIKAIENYKKNKIEEAQKAADAEIEKYYKTPYSVWERAYIISDTIQKYKMSNEDFVKFIDRNKRRLTVISFKENICGVYNEDEESDDYMYTKYVKKFGKDSDDVYDIFGNDEYGLIFEPKSKTIVEFCLPDHISFKVNMKTWSQERVSKMRFGD